MIVERADISEIAALLAAVQDVADLPARLAWLSARFLGRPYVEGPLIGSPTEPEKLVDRLDGFDCVTYMETVLALGRCSAADTFDDELVALRYERGRPGWLARNHYMSLWLERNQAKGAIEPVAAEQWETEEQPRQLSCLAGYPVVERQLSYLPVSRAELLGPVARSGDVVCFVSERSDLDTFHVGLLVAADGRAGLRHASRSVGCVVEEDLCDFLSRNDTPGMMVARPVPAGGRS